MTSTLSKGALACAFTIGMLLLGQALAEDLFRGLPEGRVVEVTFTSQGCFHQSIHEFRFRRAGSLFVEVTKVSSPWEESEIKASNPTRVPLGTVVLSDVEAVSLDRLIAFYREGREGGCTTVDSIKISQIENGKPVTTESFTDATCATDHLQGTMIFYDVIVKCSPIPKPVRVPRPDPELEHQREQANALAVCDKRPDF